ncbi:MAG: response regulator [Pseudomonadota bacterium]
MGNRILVIDDEPDATSFLTALLEDEGYQVRSASEGEEGLALLRSECFDLVLLDVRMPGKTGVRLYAEIQTDVRLKHLPVIVCTGVDSMTLTDEKCRPLAPPAFLIEKPIDRHALLAAVRSALRAG